MDVRPMAPSVVALSRAGGNRPQEEGGANENTAYCPDFLGEGSTPLAAPRSVYREGGGGGV
jgi:hypothetical protein